MMLEVMRRIAPGEVCESYVILVTSMIPTQIRYIVLFLVALEWESFTCVLNVFGSPRGVTFLSAGAVIKKIQTDADHLIL